MTTSTTNTTAPTARGPLSLKISAATREALARLAQARKRSAHAIACEAIESYIAREEARDRFTAQCQAAWEHYQETGLHLTGDEVAAWVDSWGTETELPVPACHK